MRAPFLLTLAACSAIIGCNNQQEQQVTGLPSTPPLTTTPAPSGPIFGYVVDSGHGPAAQQSVTVFSIDQQTGALHKTQTLPIARPQEPMQIAVDPTRQFAYLLSRNSRTIGVYSVDQKTGALTAVPKASFAAGTSPTALAISPNGDSLYVAASVDAKTTKVYGFATSGTGSAVSPIKGSPFEIAGPSAAIVGLTIDPGGRFLYAVDKANNAIVAFAIDTVTGALKPIGKAIPAGGAPTSLTIAPPGSYAYGISDGGVTTFKIDQTGALKPTGSTTAASLGATDVDFDPSGASIIMTDAKGIAHYSFNLADGAIHPLENLALASGTQALCATDGGKFIFVTSEDTSTGASTLAAYITDEDTGKLKPVGHASAPAGPFAQCAVLANPQ